jgi:glycosyltransferase involved in cell wall biosynthesis
MRILFLSHHWANNSHHSKHSGFQRLVAEASKSNEVTLITWDDLDSTYKDDHGITVITVKGKKRDFLFTKRLNISRKGQQIARDFDVVHALYSDCTYHLPNNEFIVTFHVLPDVTAYHSWKQKIFINLKFWLLQKRAMKRSKEIVCVSNNLVQSMPKSYQNKIQFIPHGVDTEFWDPKLCSAGDFNDLEPYMLCVGSHGIDRPSLEEFIVNNPKTRFVMVGLGKGFDHHSNVKRLPKLSDEELRDLYFHASAILKPVLFATANNSILEALSMGKTIITSRIAGITDYLNDSTCIYIDRLPNQDLSNLTPSLFNPGEIRDYSVKNFSWNVILDQYIRCYTKKTQKPNNG